MTRRTLFYLTVLGAVAPQARGQYVRPSQAPPSDQFPPSSEQAAELLRKIAELEGRISALRRKSVPDETLAEYWSKQEPGGHHLGEPEFLDGDRGRAPRKPQRVAADANSRQSPRGSLARNVGTRLSSWEEGDMASCGSRAAVVSGVGTAERFLAASEN